MKIWYWDCDVKMWWYSCGCTSLYSLANVYIISFTTCLIEESYSPIKKYCHSHHYTKCFRSVEPKDVKRNKFVAKKYV